MHGIIYINNNRGGTLHKKLGQRAGRPASIQSLQNNFIVDIDCGDFHSAALTKNGEIYTYKIAMYRLGGVEEVGITIEGNQVMDICLMQKCRKK